MLYNDKNIGTLEFDKVRAMLAECAATEGAKAEALELTPSVYPEEILRRLRRTTDSRRLIDAKGTPSFGLVSDVREICERADKGATLSARELLDVANVLLIRH